MFEVRNLHITEQCKYNHLFNDYDLIKGVVGFTHFKESDVVSIAYKHNIYPDIVASHLVMFVLPSYIGFKYELS